MSDDRYITIYRQMASQPMQYIFRACTNLEDGRHVCTQSLSLPNDIENYIISKIQTNSVPYNTNQRLDEKDSEIERLKKIINDLKFEMKNTLTAQLAECRERIADSDRVFEEKIKKERHTLRQQFDEDHKRIKIVNTNLFDEKVLLASFISHNTPVEERPPNVQKLVQDVEVFKQNQQHENVPGTFDTLRRELEKRRRVIEDD